MVLPQPVPDLVSLDLLQSVAELGSIRRAALAHGVSQPAASMRLRSLEAALGLQLLDRSSGRAHLTSAGVAVVQWSAGVLDGVRTLLAGAAALRNEGRSHLRIAASMTVAEYLVPTWLSRLRAADPDLAVSLEMGNSGHVAELMRRHGADLGFVEGSSVPSELASRVVESDDLVLVVAPSHPWAHRREPVGATELAATPLVLREPGSGTREVLEEALAAFGLAPTPLVELGSTTAIKAAIGSGAGPAVLSRLATRTEVADGRLVIVATKEISLRRDLRVIWPSDEPLSAAAKALLRHIEAGEPGEGRDRLVDPAR
jgi:DNA-binding transcriptional LysR family regulator